MVQIITYEDDYKHRYDDGIYPQTPIFFDTEKEANAYVKNEMVEYISDNKNINYEECNNMTMEELEMFLVGEFVNKTFTYKICQVVSSKFDF